MKTQFLCVCLFLLFTRTVSADATTVLDIEGNELKQATKYYVLSADWGPDGGGGLSVSKYSSRYECPTTVTLEPDFLDYGIPCSFHQAVSADDGNIHLSKSLHVSFDPDGFDSVTAACTNSTLWTVGGKDSYTGLSLVSIGGVKGEPGCSTRTSWFKIEQGWIPYAYKFTFNPDDVCSEEAGGHQIYDISMRSVLGTKPLVLSPDVLPFFNVRFLKYKANVNVIRTKAAAAAA